MTNPYFSPRAWQLLALAWALLTLGLLGQAVRNGRYLPIFNKPGLCLDTRTGEVHLVRLAGTLPTEMEAASQDKQDQVLRRGLLQ